MAPCSDSLSLRLASELNLAAGQQLAGSFYKRHAVTALRLLRLLAGARFQVLFHSPPGVLFTFPSRYLCAIGHRRVFRLGWWSTQVRTGFHVPGPTQAPRPRPTRGYAYGAVTLCRRPSHAVRLPWIGARRGRQPPGVAALQPRRRERCRAHAPAGLAMAPFRSPLLGGSRS